MRELRFVLGAEREICHAPSEVLAEHPERTPPGVMASITDSIYSRVVTEPHRVERCHHRL
jgi:hypothetical protein